MRIPARNLVLLGRFDIRMNIMMNIAFINCRGRNPGGIVCDSLWRIMEIGFSRIWFAEDDINMLCRVRNHVFHVLSGGSAFHKCTNLFSWLKTCRPICWGSSFHCHQRLHAWWCVIGNIHTHTHTQMFKWTHIHICVFCLVIYDAKHSLPGAKVAKEILFLLWSNLVTFSSRYRRVLRTRLALQEGVPQMPRTVFQKPSDIPRHRSGALLRKVSLGCSRGDIFVVWACFRTWEDFKTERMLCWQVEGMFRPSSAQRASVRTGRKQSNAEQTYLWKTGSSHTTCSGSICQIVTR